MLAKEDRFVTTNKINLYQRQVSQTSLTSNVTFNDNNFIVERQKSIKMLKETPTDFDRDTSYKGTPFFDFNSNNAKISPAQEYKLKAQAQVKINGADSP